jgi:hypothetical protein
LKPSSEGKIAKRPEDQKQVVNRENFALYGDSKCDCSGHRSRNRLGNYQQTVKQAGISERALKASSRNVEMANLLTSLRTTCSDVFLLNQHYFDNSNFQYNTNFYIPNPKSGQPDGQRYVRFVGGDSYPDPNRPEVLSDAQALGEHAGGLLQHYEIVQLYLTEEEAREADHAGLRSPFVDFQDLSASIVRQELNARDVLEYTEAASIMCKSLPQKVAAWFRNSEANKLNYILKLDDLKFQWVSSPEELWMMRDPVGHSLEERDETGIRDNHYHVNDTQP